MSYTEKKILNVTQTNPLNWDTVESYTRGIYQAESSFDKKHFSIHTCVKGIKVYTYILHQGNLFKSLGIRYFPALEKQIMLSCRYML